MTMPSDFFKGRCFKEEDRWVILEQPTPGSRINEYISKNAAGEKVFVCFYEPTKQNLELLGKRWNTATNKFKEERNTIYSCSTPKMRGI